MKSKREIAVSRMIKGFVALLMALVLTFAVTSCKTEPEDNPTYYTVTYSTEHASAPEKLTVTDGTALTAEQLPALTAEGYTFGGWYDGQTKAEAGYKVTKNVTLTAKWTVNTYTVTLNNNGSTDTITATYGKNLPDLEAIPTLEGSTFGGYYTEPYAKGTKFIDKDGKGSKAWNLTENTVLYAAWGYPITYKNTKDVQNTNPEIYTGGETVTLVNLEKEGYTFNGWFDAETGGNKVESIAQGSTGAKTFYAQWTANTYTVTLNSNGSTNTITATYGKPLPDLAAIPTLEGSTFGGYYTEPYAKGTKFIDKDGKGITAWNLTEDTTLYAAWGYSITYKNTKDVENTNPEIYTGEEGVTLANLEKEGYTFNGWYDAETGGNKVESIAQGSTGAKTFYAQWTLIAYTITYEGLNGAANPNTATSYTVKTETITLQNPTRTGYIFTGWYNAETGGNKIESIVQGSTGAKTFYAQWTLITYTITYEGLNGAANPNTITSYTVETETITLQDFSHDDYTFEGWFDAETGGNKVTSIPKGSTGNKTLYAHCTWKWIGTKNPTTAKTVGDIVFSDGSATVYTSELTLTNEQKSKAVAVIYYAGSAEDVLGVKTLGVGLKNANTLQWARYTSSDDKAEGYSTNITAIQCTPSENGSGKAATATFTGDTDGSDNWQALCKAVSDEESSGNYPAWEWVNAYATENSLVGSYANGWYLPTLAELSMLYRVKDTVNSALEKAGGTKIADMQYWSSSQNASYSYIAWKVSFYDGYLEGNPKTDFYAVCTVRAF